MSSPPTSVTVQGIRLVFDSTRIEKMRKYDTLTGVVAYCIAGYWADGSRT